MHKRYVQNAPIRLECANSSKIHSRYMIDMNAYHELHPESNTRRENWRMGDIDEATMESDNPPPEKFLLCLPATLRGYWFLKKRWGKFWRHL